MDIKGYIEESKKFNSKGDYLSEQNILGKALEENPNDVELNQLLAKSYLATKNYRKAREYGRKAVELDGGDEEKYVILGDIYNELGKYELASRNYILAYLWNQERKDIAKKLSIISFITGKSFEELMEGSYTAETLEILGEDELDIEECIKTARAYWHNEDFLKAEEYLKGLLELDEDNIFFLLELGYIYFYSERYEEAENCFKEVLELDSDIRNAYLYLGKIYYFEGIDDKVISCFEKVLELDPDNIEANAKLGAIYYIKHQNKKAKSYLYKVVDLDVSEIIKEERGYYELANATLGSLYFINKKYDKAEIYLNKTVELNPNNKIAVEKLAKLNFLKNKNRLEEEVINEPVESKDKSSSGKIVIISLIIIVIILAIYFLKR